MAASAASSRREVWANEKLVPLLEPLLMEMLRDMPEDPKLFMAKSLADRKAGKSPAAAGVKLDAEEVQEIRKSMRKSITEAFIPPPRSSAVGGAPQVTTDAASRVKERWEYAHKGEEDPSKRVTLEKLMEVAQAPKGDDKASRAFGIEMNESDKLAHKAFVEALFLASVGLMLPNNKTDLGKHCFGYAILLNDEYRPGASPKDALGLLSLTPLPEALQTARAELREDFSGAKTSGSDSVAKDSFVKVLLARHAAKLKSEGPSEEDLTAFLGRVFDAMALLSGTGAAGDLDRHAFTYAGYFAYEFYFKDVPVADLYGITKK